MCNYKVGLGPPYKARRMSAVAKRKKQKWFRPIVQGVIISLLASGITLPLGYYVGRKSLKREVAAGLRVLDVESTAEALNTIAATADSIVSG